MSDSGSTIHNLTVADGPRVEVAMVPATSPFAPIVKSAAMRAGAAFVPVDLASPADVAGRILVVDLTRVMVAQRLGRRVIAISSRNDLDCYDIVRPDEVDLRVSRALRNLVEIERLRSAMQEERETVQILNEIGFALSAITDSNELLQRILTHARRALRADGGSIYLKDGDRLIFAAAQNDTVDFKPGREHLPISDNSLAGYVANRGQLLKIDSLDEVPASAPYRPNQKNDKALGYQTRSALLVPMLDRDGAVIGVLATYNRKTVPGIPLASFDRVLPFTDRDAALARSIASQAAVAMENHRLYSDIRNLFDSFVTAAVTVIEARDPSTAGHSHRVARLTTSLAQAASDSADKPFREIRFSANELEELHYASVLHDFGKVGVPEQVLLKADKLYPYELDRIEGRFKLAAMQARLEVLRRQNGADILTERITQLDDDLLHIRRMNKPGFRFCDPDVESLMEIADRWYIESLEEPVLTGRDITRLCIPRGSLDEDERRAIEQHVVHTYNFLKIIPWTRHLKNVPELAHAHHEKLDGTGYPLGLHRNEIPYGARMMAICDIFDALTAGDRPYKSSMTIERAHAILREEADQNRVESDAVDLFFARKLWVGVITPR
ncbi:MAG: GAF domain-containing protein [Proteobacteria bacterium]|nr:GAF domain-containing protein [Pseudomonadota bacterium]MCP4916736.1 GAF domain-containing protein [Pseudomonadota bacterium]